MCNNCHCVAFFSTKKRIDTTAVTLFDDLIWAVSETEVGLTDNESVAMSNTARRSLNNVHMLLLYLHKGSMA